MWVVRYKKTGEAFAWYPEFYGEDLVISMTLGLGVKREEFSFYFDPEYYNHQ